MTDQQRAATKRRQRTNHMFIGMVVAFSARQFKFNKYIIFFYY